MIAQGFQVVTEFKFDVAAAILESERLKKSVGGISDAAEEAMFSMKSASMGFLANFGAFGGGLMGFFINAVQGSEKFEQSQRNLANIFLSNSKLFKQIDFNSAMNLSGNIMNKIGEKAFDFGVDPNQMAEQVKIIAPMLLAKGKENPMTLGNSMEISRGLLKSAPTLGIDPGNLGMQLIDMVNGQASGNNTLFQRLAADTGAFRDAKVTNAKQFNALDGAKQLDLFTRAITEFGNNAEIVQGNVRSLTFQITTFKNLMLGQFSIFKGLGSTIGNMVGQILFKINEWINTHGRKIVASFTKIFDRLLKDPEKLFAQIQQLMGLKKDFDFTTGVVKALGMMEALKGLASLFKIDLMKMPLVGGIYKFVQGLTGNFAAAAHGAAGGGIMAMVGGLFTSIFRVIVKVAGPILYFLQIFTRAAAYAKMDNWKFAAENAARFSAGLEKMQNALTKILAPIEMGIDWWARLIGTILNVEVAGGGILFFLEMFANILNFVGDVIIHVVSLISGLMNILISTIGSLVTLDFANFKNAGDWGEQGYQDVWKQYNPKEKNGEMPVGQSVTNIGKVEIINDFKEQMEPDRVAFALTSQLTKIAQNPQQATGRSFSRGLTQN